MGQNFISCDRGQEMLLPPSLTDAKTMRRAPLIGRRSGELRKRCFPSGGVVGSHLPVSDRPIFERNMCARDFELFRALVARAARLSLGRLSTGLGGATTAAGIWRLARNLSRVPSRTRVTTTRSRGRWTPGGLSPSVDVGSC